MARANRDKIYLFIEAHRLKEEDVAGEVETWYDELLKIRDVLDKLMEEDDVSRRDSP